MIDKFDAEYFFLSNFYPCVVHYDGASYSSVEHAFQAAKTHDPAERARIRNAANCGTAKRLGRSVRLRPDWESAKVGIMRELLREKFTAPELAALLLGTGDVQLVEGNTWNDRFWGVSRGHGKNVLGTLLMEVRAELRERRAKEAV